MGPSPKNLENQKSNKQTTTKSYVIPFKIYQIIKNILQNKANFTELQKTFPGKETAFIGTHIYSITCLLRIKQIKEINEGEC